MKRNRPVYKDTQFDSDGEKEVFQWFEELGTAFKYQPDSIELIEEFSEMITEKNKPKKKTILRNLSYTADFKVALTSLPLHIMKVLHFRVSSDGNIYIDVKGGSIKNGKFKYVQSPDSVKFSVIQKVAWDKKKVFINKISAVELFHRTWVPDDCVLTAKTKQPKKAYIGCISKEEFDKKNDL